MNIQETLNAPKQYRIIVGHQYRDTQIPETGVVTVLDWDGRESMAKVESMESKTRYRARVEFLEPNFKKITNGDAYALIILAADKMGLNPSSTEQARTQLKGGPIHPMTGAAMEKESVEMNNLIRHDVALIEKANGFVQEIAAEFGFEIAPAA